MKNISRRLLACLLGAALALAAPCALASQATTAQIELVLEDGSQQVLPVQLATAFTGETVYWLDMSAVTEEQAAVLDMGTLVVLDETGGEMLRLPLEGSDAGTEGEGMVMLYDELNPDATCVLLLASQPLPEDQGAIDELLDAYGYTGEDPYAGDGQEDGWSDGQEDAQDEEQPDGWDEGEPGYIEENPDADPADTGDTGDAAEDTGDAGDEGGYEAAPPQYVVPAWADIALLSAPDDDPQNALALVGPADLLAVTGWALDDEGNTWWQVEDYRTGMNGVIREDAVNAVDEKAAGEATVRIDAEIVAAAQAAAQQAEEAARQEAERQAEAER